VAIERLPGGADTAHVVNAGEVVSFTSGTTGVPKAIVHSERTIAAALVMLVDETDPQVHNREITSNSMADLLQRADGDVSYFEGGPVLLSCMPPWTQGGFTMMNYATFMGCHLVVSWPFDAESALDQIERHAATSIGLSPFMAQLILRAQRYRPRKTESLLVVGLGGGPVSPRLAKNLEATFDCRVLIGYGLTETGGAVVRSRWSDPSEVRTQTVGSPMPGVELGLRHLPGQHSTEPAELRVRTRSLMVATIDELGHRQSVDPDSWLDTGDLAVVDGPGAIRIVGRLASLIVRGGRNIDPSTIEATLRDHAQVADCAVVGVESRLEGEQDVVAYVVLGTDLEPSKHELVAHCKARLPIDHVPSRFRFVDTLPRAHDGEVRRQALAAEARLATGPEYMPDGMAEEPS
jgi:acyl-CoA synthetase (AMP-forming)/AMP-acid ligase II